ncbi:hypothetical protein EG329_003293 [Mollisiaceae sp. DMI_Dod_QoI]|nr:hypothetical protein EG329_003293 [Helotiales sp. DMI_Dod_QoI]
MTLQPTDSTSVKAPPHQISCTLCRQRKVKCDKQQRCSNCVKAGIECLYVPPARPRRHIGNGKSPEDVSRGELIDRVRRYEALFRKHGLQFEASDRDSAGDENRTLKSHPATSTTVVIGQMLTGEGVVSRLPQQTGFWAEDLSGEILEDFFDRDSSAASVKETPQETTSALGLSLAFQSAPSTESLSSFHPSTGQIFRLWETFLNNVDPLVKIIHVPTVQRQLLQASVDLQNLSEAFEALMFSIYASAVTSLSNEECLELTSVSKSQLLERYQKITKKALARAGLLGTLDVVVLQAAVLFVHSISLIPESDHGELYVLAGIILRAGERIGLHRRTYPANLSVIEAQTRRRLWWHIIVLDSRCAQRSRVDAPVNGEYWGSVLPLNVNDSELTPEMMVEPRGHAGSTEMTFRLMMYDIGKFIRYSEPTVPFGGTWQKLTAQSVPLAEKDKMIDELEMMLESKYLRYCDPAIPLYVLARRFASIVISKMRLTIRHPRRFPDRGSSMPKDEKRKLFDICLSIIEQVNFIRSMNCLRGFLWPLDQEFQVDAVVYLLSELRYQDPSPLTEKAWSEIFKAFTRYPDIVFAGSALNVAIGNLTLKSWESWEARAQHQQFQHPSRPDFILQLLEKRPGYTTSASIESAVDAARMDLDSHAPASYLTSIATDWNSAPSLISDPLAPIDWNYWNDLIQNDETYNTGDFAAHEEWPV